MNELRELMMLESIDAFIFPSTDPHNGEYVPDHWKGREWVSGFNGSAGTAVVTLDDAALWTDSRYFLAAAEQLEGTGFRLMKDGVEGTPTIVEWLKRKLSANGGTCVGVDGMVMAASEVMELKAELSKCGITVRHNYDPLKALWRDRPAIPENEVIIHGERFAGESTASKLGRIREAMAEVRADYHLVTMLDDVAWTLNLRGTDVHCNPVFVSYLLIGREDAVLFIDGRKLTKEVRDYLAGNNIKVREYGETKAFLQSLVKTKHGVNTDVRILMDAATTCFTLYDCVRDNVRQAASPIPMMKAVKNPTEIEGYRSAMLKDGVALVKFTRWLKETIKNGNETVTEISADRKLTALRAEQDGFRDISFDTIVGYEKHGAIVHYEATPETDIPLEPHGFVLIDSGAQYDEGTTDITRTIPLGPLSDLHRKVYTLVLKGNIDLAMAKFPDGASGTQIDAYARMAMWREGMNYGHGTGHGVGSCLNVHEGPHQIRMQWKPAPLRAGMTVTDEPGLYLADRFGVRIENTMHITDYVETEFGRFLQLESLTLCPIDMEPIIFSMLTQEEISWLNDYHRKVREALLPLLDDEADRAWLVEATEELTINN